MDPVSLPALSGSASHAVARSLDSLPSLSLDARVDEALRALLSDAVPRIVAHARHLEPRLILLAGSAACGEACGVHDGGRLLALSDLDLLVFTDRSGVPDEKVLLARALDRDLREHLERLRFASNPIDAGIFPRSFFAQTAFTLELAEAVSGGIVLWGEANILSPARARRPGAFEGFRLMMNRVVETALPSGSSIPARGSSTPAHGSSIPLGDRPGAPSVGEPGTGQWKEAYRWSKLALDAGKAWLAARGLHEASFRKRLALAEREAASLSDEKGARTIASPPEERALTEWLNEARIWSAWRASPAWPPPEARPQAIAALARDIARLVAGQGPMGEDGALDGAALRRILEQEEGSPRERLRAWRRAVGHRPAGVSLPAALRLALRWRGAWPRSLFQAAFALAWMDAGDASLRAALAGDLPRCRGLELARWNDEWMRALAETVEWGRAAGL